LKQFLLKFIDNPSLEIKDIVDDFLSLHEKEPSKEKNWYYYFIKYKNFREFEDGYYLWKKENAPYECIMLNRKNFWGKSWCPFLKTIKNSIIDNHLTLNNRDAPLEFKINKIHISITNHNNYFELKGKTPESNEMLKNLYDSNTLTYENKVLIKQSQNGLDIEDRVQKGIELIKKIKLITETENHF